MVSGVQLVGVSVAASRGGHIPTPQGGVVFRIFRVAAENREFKRFHALLRQRSLFLENHSIRELRRRAGMVAGGG